MEIVIVFLLLIGAVSFDANRSTSEETALKAAVEARVEQKTNRTKAESRPRPCRYGDGSLVQRDLTVPRASAVPVTSRAAEEVRPESLDE